MTVWEFWNYREHGGNIPFEDWLHGIPMDAGTFIGNRIALMEGMRKWNDKWVSSYECNYPLFELRPTFKGVAYRPIFIYCPHVRMRIIILCGAIEKSKIPKRDIDNSIQRAKIYSTDPQRAIKHFR